MNLHNPAVLVRARYQIYSEIQKHTRALHIFFLNFDNHIHVKQHSQLYIGQGVFLTGNLGDMLDLCVKNINNQPVQQA